MRKNNVFVDKEAMGERVFQITMDIKILRWWVRPLIVIISTFINQSINQS